MRLSSKSAPSWFAAALVAMLGGLLAACGDAQQTVQNGTTTDPDRPANGSTLIHAIAFHKDG